MEYNNLKTVYNCLTDGALYFYLNTYFSFMGDLFIVSLVRFIGFEISIMAHL